LLRQIPVARVDLHAVKAPLLQAQGGLRILLDDLLDLLFFQFLEHLPNGRTGYG